LIISLTLWLVTCGLCGARRRISAIVAPIYAVQHKKQAFFALQQKNSGCQEAADILLISNGKIFR
jgi:hypothetical protein